MATRSRFAGQGDYLSNTGVDKWLNVFGDVQVIKNLDRLKTKLQRQMLRKAIAKGLKPVVKLAKRKAPRKKGLLRRAIKSKVTRMISGKVYVDPKVFAARNDATGGEYKIVKTKGVKGGYRKIKAELIKQGGKTDIIKPANYAHIVEFGSQKHRMKPQPFMRPAMSESRDTVINTIAGDLKTALKAAGAT